MTARLFAGAALTLGACHFAPAIADDFYKGKTIKLYIGSGPGGGYDLFGRLVARHIGKHLPGNPAVTPQNMPGAGSILATNYLFNVAPKDGLSLAIASPSLALIEALQTPGVRFTIEKLNWIGRISPNINVTVTRRGSAVKTVDDARKQETLILHRRDLTPDLGLTGHERHCGHAVQTGPRLCRFRCNSSRHGAWGSRGHDGLLGDAEVDKIGVDQDRAVNLLVQYSLQRSRDLKDVPAATETATSPDDKRLLSLFVSGADVGYAIFTAPGVSPDRIEILRAAFTQMTLDPAFKEDSEKWEIDLEPMAGSDLQTMIESTTVFPESVRERAKEVAKAE